MLVGLAMVPASLASPTSALLRPSSHRQIATYLDAWTTRDLNAIVRCMDEGVRLIGPNLHEIGRDAYRASTERFLPRVSTVVVDDVAPIPRGHLIWWRFDCGPQIGMVPTAERITLDRGLITISELIFDTAPFKAPPSK